MRPYDAVPNPVLFLGFADLIKDLRLPVNCAPPPAVDESSLVTALEEIRKAFRILKKLKVPKRPRSRRRPLRYRCRVKQPVYRTPALIKASRRSTEAVEEPGAPEAHDDSLISENEDKSFESFCEVSEREARSLLPELDLEKILGSFDEESDSRVCRETTLRTCVGVKEAVERRPEPDLDSLLGSYDAEAEQRVRALLHGRSSKVFILPDLLRNPVILPGGLVDTDPRKVTVPPGFPFLPWLPPMPCLPPLPQYEDDEFEEEEEEEPFDGSKFPHFTPSLDPHFVNFPDSSHDSTWQPQPPPVFFKKHDFISPPSGTVYFMSNSHAVNNPPVYYSEYEEYYEDSYCVNSYYDSQFAYSQYY